MNYRTENPYTGEEIQVFENPLDSSLEVELNALEKGAFSWKNTSLKERGDWVLKLAMALDQDKQRLARIIAIEMGKPITQGVQEIEKCVALCRYYAERAETMMSQYQEEGVLIEPLGLILGIMPWNFPFWQVFRLLIPSLMVGNVVMIKPAPNVPQCALAIAELFHTIDCEEKLYSNAFLTEEQVEKVIADSRVKGVSFTGSVSVGRHIAKLSGKYLKKLVLELGGSDPFIAFDDLDWEGFMDSVVKARCHNAGQTCIASKRFIVHKDIFDRFLMALTTALDELKMGDPLDPETTLGPLARPDLKMVLEEQLSVSLDLGAKSRYSRQAPVPDQGYFFAPQVLTHLLDEMPVLREETFGPIFAIIPFGNEDEAVHLANNTNYGLGASLWTEDQSRVHRLLPQIEAGSVAVNQVLSSDPSRPFGGIKHSGFGRELGSEGLFSFVNLKTVYGVGAL